MGISGRSYLKDYLDYLKDLSPFAFCAYGSCGLGIGASVTRAIDRIRPEAACDFSGAREGPRVVQVDESIV